MVSQALEPLRAAGLPLVAWGGPALAELFEGSNAFDAVVSDGPRKPGARSMAALLREHRASAVLSLPRSQRACMAGLLAGVRRRVGWSDGLGWLLCTHSLFFRKLEGHQLARYGALLRKGFPDHPEVSWKPLVPRANAKQEAERLLAGLHKPFVAIGIGARSWNKRVGVPVWVGLGKRLAEQGTSLVLLGVGSEEQGLAAEVCAAVPESLDLTGQTPLSVMAAILNRSVGAFGGDSALCHMAGACGVPTVAIFGPTDPSLTAPNQPWVRLVSRQDLPCLPCRTFQCEREGHPCMQSVEPEVLLAALEEARNAKPAATTVCQT